MFQQFNMYVKRFSGTMFVHSVKAMQSIRDLKQSIATHSILSPKGQAPALIFNGRLLQDALLVGDYGIIHGSIIYIRWRLAGEVNSIEHHA